MPESQTIVYKKKHDKYLKWICGFANAQGRVNYICIDDASNVVGIENYKRLMADFPIKKSEILWE